MPERIQLSRAKGWRMPPNTVKVDRTTQWGNPIRTRGDGIAIDNRQAVKLFSELIDAQNGWTSVKGHFISRADARTALKGRNLACWCSLDEACHVDVLLALANTT